MHIFLCLVYSMYNCISFSQIYTCILICHRAFTCSAHRIILVPLPLIFLLSNLFEFADRYCEDAGKVSFRQLQIVHSSIFLNFRGTCEDVSCRVVGVEYKLGYHSPETYYGYYITTSMHHGSRVGTSFSTESLVNSFFIEFN